MNDIYDDERTIAAVTWQPPEEDTYSDLSDAIDDGVCRVVFASGDDQPNISTARLYLEPKPDRARVRRRMRRMQVDGSIPRFRLRFDGADAFTPGLPVWTLFRGTRSDFQRVAYKVLARENELVPFFSS